VGPLAIVLLLSGCGGGGGSSDANVVTDPVVDTPDPADEPDIEPVVSIPAVDDGEALPGGEATRHIFDNDAFSFAPSAIEDDFQDDANFKSGNQLFRTESEGLGPLMNANTCQACHIKDGRGQVPIDARIHR